jgi:hypothetical protein
MKETFEYVLYWTIFAKTTSQPTVSQIQICLPVNHITIVHELNMKKELLIDR